MPTPTNPSLGSDLVPVVDPTDVRTAWQILQEVHRLHPGKRGLYKHVAAAMDGLKDSCAPGADLGAISYRAGLLDLLFRIRESIKELSPELEQQTSKLAGWQKNGTPETIVFEVMASFPLLRIDDRMRLFPFNVDRFIDQLDREWQTRAR
jgi:hypothetical protein